MFTILQNISTCKVRKKKCTNELYSTILCSELGSHFILGVHETI